MRSIPLPFVVLALLGATAAASDATDPHRPVQPARLEPKAAPGDWWVTAKLVSEDGEGGKPLAGAKGAVPVPGSSLHPLGASGLQPWAAFTRVLGAPNAAATDFDLPLATPFAAPAGADGVVKLGPLPAPVGGEAVFGGDGSLSVVVKLDHRKYPLKEGRVLDLGTVKIPRGHALAGVVRDAEGKPVANAWVAAQRSSVDPARAAARAYEAWGGPRFARTDAEGRYTLAGLSPDWYLAAAWTPEAPPAFAKLNLSEREGAWANVTQDFALGKGLGVTVAVQEERGGKAEPVRGALATAILNDDCAALGFPGERALAAGAAYSDEAGTLRVGGLPEVDDAANVLELRVHNPFGSGYVSRTELANGDTYNALFRYGALKLTFQDDAGKPVQGVQATLVCDAPHAIGGFEWTAPPTHYAGDLDAGFEMPRCLVGRWTVTLKASGYQDTAVPLEVKPEGASAAVTMALNPGLVRGALTDAATGKPVAGASIEAEAGLVGYRKFLKGRSDDAGLFTLDGIDGDGKYNLIVIDAPGYVVLRKRWTMHGHALNLGTLELAPACEVKGALTEGGKPSAFRRVHLQPVDKRKFGYVQQNQRITAFTDAEGRWTFPRIPAGTWQVFADDALGALATVEAKPGEPADAGALAADGD